MWEQKAKGSAETSIGRSHIVATLDAMNILAPVMLRVKRRIRPSAVPRYRLSGGPSARPTAARWMQDT